MAEQRPRATASNISARNFANPGVTRVVLRQPDVRATQDGVVAHATVDLADAIRFDVVVRQDPDGGLRVSYPTRHARGGRRHRLVEILTSDLRDEVSVRVLSVVRGAAESDDQSKKPKRSQEP